MSVIHLLRKHRRVTEDLTDLQLPKHRHRKYSKQVVGKKKYLNVYTYTRYWSIQDKKRWRASYREFPLILKMKDIFSLKKNINQKFPDAVSEGML